MDDDTYTAESFAWKLLMDDDDNDSLGTQLQTFAETYDEEDDPITFFYEIILTILMELIFGIMQLNNQAEGNDDSYVPDYKKYDIDTIMPILIQKFVKLHIMIYIIEIDRDENIDDRYCKIIFRHNQADEFFFNRYKNNIPDDKNYHMILNGKYAKQTELNNIYSTCSLNNKMYKISFNTRQKQ